MLSDNGCVGPLLGGASCVIRVKFAPTYATSRSAVVMVSGSPGGSVSVVLNAIGLGAQLNVFAYYGSSAGGVPFGMAKAGSGSTSAMVIVSNSGNIPSGAVTLTIDGTDAAEFSASPISCNGIAPNASCWTTVRFSPSSTGEKAARLTATAAPGGSASIKLAGTGT